jgi:putative zinc finger protein
VEPVPETCLPYDEDLSALLDGELSPARAAQLRAHCASCPRCTEQLAELRRANERLLSTLRVPVPGEGARIARVEAQLRVRLAQESQTGVESRRQSRTQAPPRRRRNARWIVVAATGLAAAAALGLALLLQPRAPVRLGPSPQPPIAQNPPPVPPAPAPQEEPPAVSRLPEAVAELPVVKPAPARRPPPAPPAPQHEQVTPPLPSAAPEIDLASADEEDVELAQRLDMLEDFEVIQKLDLLERLQKAEDGAGSG